MIKYLLTLFTLITIFGCQKSNQIEKSPKKYLLQKIAQKESGVYFINRITEDPQHNILNYIYYYNGGGVAIGDINNDELPDLYFVSNMDKNKLYLNKGNLQFEDITEKAGVGGSASWNTGATMVDINDDGLLDIYISAVSGLLDFEGHNELFINNGDGTFKEESEKYGLDFKGYATQAYFFDYDKDLDLDVYIVNHAVHTTLSHGPASVRNERKPFVGDVLLENQNGKFSDVSDKAGIYGGVNGYGLSASLADFNNDGWDDLYICNDFHEDDYYYLNNQDGTFSENLCTTFSTISRFSMGSDAADINGDGYLDLITLDMLPKDEMIIKESEGDDAMYNMQKRLKKLGYREQYARNMLQINNKGGYFNETAIFNGIEATDWSWGPLIADFNNDGHQDIFIANGILKRPNDLDFKNYVSNAFKNRNHSEGVKWLYNAKDHMPDGKVSNEIYQGNSKRLKNMTGNWIEDRPSHSNGAAYADLDRDGDLDLIVNNLNEPAEIYENTITGSNFITINLGYKKGNQKGIGSKAIVHSKGRSQLKQIFNSRGFLSAVDTQLHFGLGNANQIDSIEIFWPDNTYQNIKNVESNQFLKIDYAGISNQKTNTDNEYKIFELQNLISFKHEEDSRDDFFYEKLIPYKVSNIGPAISTGDFDKNGYDDIFIGNASGKKAVLYLNDGKEFRKLKDETLDKDFLYEDNTAVFFDADMDGDLDLYIGTGTHNIGLKTLEHDRLYINNNGKLSRSKGQIPDNLYNTSIVIAEDYDKDGDQDLFIGNYSETGNFGKSVPSYLLKNDGNGNFVKDENFNFESHVTSAFWDDLNKDDLPDLVITTEWDKPKVFLNKKGILESQPIPEHMNGLWQTALSYDIDGDGDKDILLGNWGQNTRFSATPDSPLRMYHGDLNNDRKYETVVAYKLDDSYYPLNSRNELISQMNFISKKFPTHKDFSLKTIEEIFGTGQLNMSKVYRLDNLNSGYLENIDNAFKIFKAFEKPFQLAPINSFEQISIRNEVGVIVSGNSYSVNTYHGGYSSLKGLYLKSVNEYQDLTRLGMRPLTEEIRATKNIRMKDKQVLVVIPNNETLTTYSFY